MQRSSTHQLAHFATRAETPFVPHNSGPPTIRFCGEQLAYRPDMCVHSRFICGCLFLASLRLRVRLTHRDVEYSKSPHHALSRNPQPLTNLRNRDHRQYRFLYQNPWGPNDEHATRNNNLRSLCLLLLVRLSVVPPLRATLPWRRWRFTVPVSSNHGSRSFEVRTLCIPREIQAPRQFRAMWCIAPRKNAVFSRPVCEKTEHGGQKNNYVSGPSPPTPS